MNAAEGIFPIRLSLGKANAIDGSFFETLVGALDDAAANRARAVVLTGYEKYFCAGLNLKSLPSDRDGMLRFVDQFEDGMRRLWSFPLPVVAAVNGHAIAGGCVLACACDVRVGAEGDYRIGLSEVDLGVPFPGLALQIVKSVAKQHWLTDLVLGARLLRPEEARQAGILHRVVPAERLEEEAFREASRLAEKPQPAYRLTKAALHAQALSIAQTEAKDSRERFVECWFSEEVRQRRQAMLNR